MAVAVARVRLDQKVYPPEETSTATSAAAVLSVPGQTLTSILYHGCVRYLRLCIHPARAVDRECRNEAVRMFVEEILQRGILREWHKGRERTIRIEAQFLSRRVMTIAAVSRAWLSTVQQISEGQYFLLYDGETMPGHWLTLCTFLLRLQAEQVVRLAFSKCGACQLLNN